jgi:hypothetical protein
MEIAKRFEEEQYVLGNFTHQESKFGDVRRRNAEYLRRVITEVGWIDPNRFGPRTSFRAIIIAKHTEDIRILLTALKHAGADLRKSGKGQTYAILYDSVQLNLGNKQRYGTQVSEDEGGPFVLPLQNPEKVDTYLAELGLPPLQDYLAKVGKYLYQGRQVRMASDYQ